MGINGSARVQRIVSASGSPSLHLGIQWLITFTGSLTRRAKHASSPELNVPLSFWGLSYEDVQDCQPHPIH